MIVVRNLFCKVEIVSFSFHCPLLLCHLNLSVFIIVFSVTVARKD